MAGRSCASGIITMLAAGCGRISFGVVEDAAIVSDTPPDGVAVGFVFGNQTVETQGPDIHGCGSAEASSFYTLASGVVNSLVIWHAASGSNNATSLIVGLYDAIGDSPGNLLGQGTVTPGGQLANDTWYTATIPDVAIAANTVYWIAATCPVGAGSAMAVQYRYIGASGAGLCSPSASVPCTQHSGQTNLTTMPTTWSPGLMILPSVNSYYAAYY